MKIDWRHIFSSLLVLLPITLHLLQIWRPAWYTALVQLAGVIWLAMLPSATPALVDPGVTKP